MSKTSRDNKKKSKGNNGVNFSQSSTENQNHNTKKESLGPNTNR